MLNSQVLPQDPDHLAPVYRPGESSLAKPSPGRSLGGAVLAAQGPIRNAVAVLVEGAREPAVRALQLFRRLPVESGGVAEPDAVRLAWLLANVTYAHAAATGQKRLQSLLEAARWFFGENALAAKVLHAFSSQAIAKAERFLGDITVGPVMDDLYPYIIEPHGHVSRACMRNETARQVRRSKKADGVYYTPADVADFMVAEVADEAKSEGAWLDPACGTGVFLRAIVRHAKRRSMPKDESPLDFITGKVFGIDKSALATDCAAFVLFLELTHSDISRGAPIDAWLRIKRNIACIDSLTLSPNDLPIESIFGNMDGSRRLTDVFPHSRGMRFEMLVMNPPYAGTGHTDVVRGAWHAAHRSQPRTELHLAFMEMMWRLGTFRACAAVLPLSIAANTTGIYGKLRGELASSKGRKEMLFFDREPQALFGEDVKTRNAIVFRFEDAKQEFLTSSLLKWTAHQRQSIFTRRRLVPIDRKLCSRLVPKLGSEQQALVYTKFAACASEFSNLKGIEAFSRASLLNLIEDHANDARTLAIGGTAYNFLNAFFPADLPRHVESKEKLSTAPTIFLRHVDEEWALATFAVLTSRLAFWLWRVEGDGFHVSSEFVKRLPLWTSLQIKQCREALAECGHDLRLATTKNATKSVNAGKQTFSFQSQFEHPSAKKSEKLLLDTILGNDDFSTELNAILHAVVSIDGKVRRAARSPSTH